MLLVVLCASDQWWHVLVMPLVVMLLCGSDQWWLVLVVPLVVMPLVMILLLVVM